MPSLPSDVMHLPFMPQSASAEHVEARKPGFVVPQSAGQLAAVSVGASHVPLPQTGAVLQSAGHVRLFSGGVHVPSPHLAVIDVVLPPSLPEAPAVPAE